MIAATLALLLCAAPGLSGVVKAEKAGALSPEAKAALATDGSVVVAGTEPHFFALYDRNAYEGLPSFVTADAVLHLAHLRLDARLARLEQERALPALRRFATLQRDAALAELPSSGPMPAGVLRLAALHATAVALLEEPPPPVDPRLAAIVEGELRALLRADGVGASPLCDGPLDRTRFRPRGHYANWLSGYFRAATLYASCGPRLDTPEGLALALRAAAHASSPAAREALQTVREIAAELAGAADDGLGALAGPGAAALRTRLRLTPEGPAPTPAELSVLAANPVLRRRNFRWLPEAAPPDAALFLRTTSPARPLPSALDWLAAAGVPAARRHLAPELARLPGLEASLSTPLPAGGGLYGRWLALLGRFAQPPADDHPAFERTDRWADRLCVSAAGSWVELRHDTLLYVRQPLVMMQGGHPAELPAVKAGGYVEPRPELYRGVLELLDGLDRLDGAATSEAPLRELLTFLTRLSEQELAGRPFAPADDERLRGIGAELEKLTRGRADRLPDQAMTVDVAGVADEGGRVTSLQVGVGAIDELWVIVPRAGKRLLTRGAVFSYYESQSATRLTDGEFAELLRSRRAVRPAWATPLPARPRAKH